MPKTQFLQIRISPEDRERLRRAAAAEYLDASTWARQVILQALEQFDGRRAVHAEHMREHPRRELRTDLKVAEQRSPKRTRKRE